MSLRKIVFGEFKGTMPAMKNAKLISAEEGIRSMMVPDLHRLSLMQIAIFLGRQDKLARDLMSGETEKMPTPLVKTDREPELSSHY